VFANIYTIVFVLRSLTYVLCICRKSSLQSVWSDLLSDDGDGSAEDEDGGEMAVGDETPGGGQEGGREGRELKNTKRDDKSESPLEYGGSSGVPEGMLHDSSAWNGVLVCVCVCVCVLFIVCMGGYSANMSSCNILQHT